MLYKRFPNLSLLPLYALFSLFTVVFIQSVIAKAYSRSGDVETGTSIKPESSVFGTDLLIPTPTPLPVIDEPDVIDTSPEPIQPEFADETLRINDILDLSLGSRDIDCDGVLNNDDNCVVVFNPDQVDKNNNGIGDACDGAFGNEGKLDLGCDTDKDGVLDKNDNCPLVCKKNQKDRNKNGFGDVCDWDLLKEWVRIDPCSKPIKRKTRSAKHQYKRVKTKVK